MTWIKGDALTDRDYTCDFQRGGHKVEGPRDIGRKLGIVTKLLSFLWQAKLWWMIPMVVVMALIGILIGFGSASGIEPFIYTLF